MNKKYHFFCFFVLGLFPVCSFGQFNTIISKSRNDINPVLIEHLSVNPNIDINTKQNNSEVFSIDSIQELKAPVEVDTLKEVNVDPFIPVDLKEQNEIIKFRQMVSLPLEKIHVTSRYGNRIHPIENKMKPHYGIDLSADSNYVFSVMPGRVIRTGKNRRSGVYVVIEHGNYQSIYCHLTKYYVSKNDYVDAGQIIALSGNSGYSTGPHLHFSLKHYGKFIDPEPFLNYIQSLINYVNQMIESEQTY